MLSSLNTCWYYLCSLRRGQLILVLLIVVLGFGVTGKFFLNYQAAIDNEAQAVRATLERNAKLLGERTGESVMSGDLPTVRRELRLLETMPRIGRVTVHDRAGDILLVARNTGYELEFIDTDQARPEALATGLHGQFPGLGYTSRIMFNERTVGTLTLFASQSRIHDTITSRFWQFMRESFLLWCALAVFAIYLIVQTRFETRLRQQSWTDPVTGELSRFGLNELYGDHYRFRHYALVLVDLYNMKAINAGHGIATGDRVLQIVARTMRATLGPRAAVARLDGDDFAILVPATQWSSVKQLGQSLKSAVHALRFDEIDDLDKVNLCGGAVILAPTDSLSQRLFEADLALRHAKHRDWKSVVCADAAFIANSQSAGAFVTDLQIRQGLRNHEFGYYIQPLVNVETGETLGYESLIRWTHEGEIRSPAIFLDRFREVIKDDALYPYVVAMRRALTERAMRNGVGVLSYNIGLEDLQRLEHPEQLSHDFGADIQHAPQVIIEVTERGLPQHLGDDLTGLKAAWDGLRGERTVLALDDFGALESNLYRLRELDIDYVKIDKMLISAVTDDFKSRAIVESIASLCGALNIQVVAEGIESETLCQTVQSLGIVIQQGFYLGRPQAPDYYLN